MVAALRQAVPRAVDDIDPDLIAEALERGFEVLEHRVLRSGGRVFHHDDVGHRCLDGVTILFLLVAKDAV